MTEIVIAGAARTAMGAFQGVFNDVTAAELGGVAIKAAIERANVSPDDVDEVLMGCVLPAGQGQAPARQAGFAAGLPGSTPATTVNKMCGSGMKTIMLAADQLACGHVNVIVAGGMESMSNAPHLLPSMRKGARLGHAAAVDHMFLDGLEDAYEKGRLMGSFAEDCADKYNLTRQAQDEYALRSLSNAIAAHESGAFAAEIAPVLTASRGGDATIERDEQPTKARPEKIPTLRPAFKKEGTITAANASSISDGAAAVVLTTADSAAQKSLPIRATIRGYQSHAQTPGWFTTAPVSAVNKLLDQIGWAASDVDLWEVNEAFAVVPMAFMAELNLSHEIMNINGGACALGHPIGASGTRIVVTLLHAMEARGVKKGIAAICIGGGEGTAIAIELP